MFKKPTVRFFEMIIFRLLIRFFSGPSRYIRIFDVLSTGNCVLLRRKPIFKKALPCGPARYIQTSDVISEVNYVLIFSTFCGFSLICFHRNPPPRTLKTKRFASIVLFLGVSALCDFFRKKKIRFFSKNGFLVVSSWGKWLSSLMRIPSGTFWHCKT